jgi:hypothetical protein
MTPGLREEAYVAVVVVAASAATASRIFETGFMTWTPYLK